MPVPFLKRARLPYLVLARSLLARGLWQRPSYLFPFLSKKALTVPLFERLKGGPFKLRVR